MGPLALMAQAAGLTVCGSDLVRGDVYEDLVRAGIEVKIGPQDGEFLREKMGEVVGADERGVDWFVYTSALPEDHAELTLAREAGVKCTKRDDFTAYLVEKLGLKMIAVAGTHGKTTTTAMLVWAARQLKLPAAYIVGTVLPFGPAGAYHRGDKFFIYEADEYDRNFLKFRPYLSVITTVSYDHADIYPTPEDYKAAFEKFERQSENVITIDDGVVRLNQEVVPVRAEDFELAGDARRQDAALALAAIRMIAPEIDAEEIRRVLNEFPGAGRRFEKLAEGIYSDYAHHPEEIAATLDVAQDEARLRGLNGVAVVYQPHQNNRQHEVREGYKAAFARADKVFWLPTYLAREDPELAILTPADLMAGIDGAEAAELDDELARRILEEREAGRLVVLMSAGTADRWLREKIKNGEK